MFAIIGAAGNVGQSTSRALREAGASVTAILHEDAKSGPLEQIGCEVTVADLQDAEALAKALLGVDAVQVIIPLRPTAPDPVEDMQRSIDSIIEALKRARPPRVLLISDYGAHVDHDIGMPSIFHEAEARFRNLDIDLTVLRSAEHMHNWARSIAGALETGTLVQFQDPVDMPQATIAAQDLGRISADLLLQLDRKVTFEVVHAEGPRRYSAADVASALSELTGKSIQAVAVPRTQWNNAFAKMPPSLARLLIKANDAKNEGGLVDVEPASHKVRQGATELAEALKALLPPQ